MSLSAKQQIILPDGRVFPRFPWTVRLIAFALLLLHWLCASASAQPTDGHIRAGVHISPPFVMTDGDKYKGMAIDIWELVGGQLALTTEYVPYETVREMLLALESGQIDLIVTNLTVTHERAQNVKFTYPWFDAGLRIMTPITCASTVWGELWRNGHFTAYFGLLVLILMLTLAITLFRRRHDPDFPKTWREGASLNFYDLVSAVKSGNMDLCHLGWVACVLSAIWMLFGVAFIAYVTSSITTAMTTVSINGQIHSLSDLSGRKVGVFAGSVAEAYVDTIRAAPVPFHDINDAARALSDGVVQAVVADAPVLEYWTQSHPGGETQVVGNLFHPDKYAFATGREQSEFADRISVEIIRLHETGKLKELRETYFGRHQI